MFGYKFVGLFLYVIFFFYMWQCCRTSKRLRACSKLHVFDTTLSIPLISKSQCFVQANILRKNLEQTHPQGSGPPLGIRCYYYKRFFFHKVFTKSALQRYRVCAHPSFHNSVIQICLQSKVHLALLVAEFEIHWFMQIRWLESSQCRHKVMWNNKNN